MHQNHIFSVCLSILKTRPEAQEAAQDSFVKAYRALKTYKSESKFSSWLYKIAYRTCLDYIRKRKPSEDLDQHDFAMAAEENKSESFENKELSHLLLKAIGELKSDEAALVRMYYLEEMNIRELEEITGMTNSSIKVKLFRARKKLMEIIQNRYVEIEDFIR